MFNEKEKTAYEAKQTEGHIANSAEQFCIAPCGDTGMRQCATFRPCGYNLEVTKDGKVRHIGSSKLRKPQIVCNAKTFEKHGKARVGAYYEGKMYYPNVAQLVARAWLPEWYEGCGIIWKDGDTLNNHADNLRVCTKSEQRRAITTKAYRMKCERQNKDYGVFKPCGVWDIECTKDGIFRRKGVIYHPTRTTANHRKTIKLCITIDGRRMYFQAADLVCRAWKPDYSEDMYVARKDKDIYNIHADNLALVPLKQFNSWAYSTTNDERIPTVEETKERLMEIQKECQMNIDYLENGSYDAYNKYVEETLYNDMMNYCIVSCDQSKSKAAVIVQRAITDLYELIDTNRMVYSPRMFCTRRVKLYSEGRHPKMMHALPNKVNNEIVKLNLDALCSRYKVQKKRHKNLA